MEILIKHFNLLHVEQDVVLFETLKILPSLTVARRLSLCIFVGLCTDGIATLMVNGWKRIVTHNQVIIVTEESVVENINFSEDFDGIGFFLSYNMLQDILQDLNKVSNVILISHNHPIFGVSDEKKRELKALFGTLVITVGSDQHRNTKEMARLIIQTLVYSLTPIIDLMFTSVEDEKKRSSAEKVFVKFIKMLEQNFKDHREVWWYAEQLGVSPKYLSDAVTTVSRRNPNKWIDKFVCTEIRNQLRHTDKPLGELAKELNFSSQSFFGRYFKTNVGLSPSEYREGVEP